MIAIAAASLLATLVAVIVVWQLIGDVSLTAIESLDVAREGAGQADEALILAVDVLATLEGGLDDAHRAVESLGASMTQGRDALEGVERLTGEDLADALENVEEALPAIEQAASAIDDTIAVLGALGGRAPSEPSLASSIAQLAAGLSGLPEDLREQAERIGRTSEELEDTAAATLDAARALEEMRERTRRARSLVEGSAEAATDLDGRIERQQEVLGSSARRARILAVMLAMIFASSQFVPLYLGRQLLHQDHGDDGAAG